MSKIAEALAKAKERTGHTTVPFMSGAGAAAPIVATEKKAAALRKARRVQRFWLVLSGGALLLTVVVFWIRWGQAQHDAIAVSTTYVPAAVVSDVSVASKEEPAGTKVPSKLALIDQVPVTVTLPTEENSQPGAAAVPAPRPNLQAEVNTLLFTAVMPGERPRVMYKGRVVNVGEHIEGELVFAGIHDGRLVFNDARGAIYLRRY